jgi:hypothetical protein
MLLAIMAVGVVAALAVSCGGGSPSSSTPVTTVPAQPSPTPPGGGPGTLSCPLGKGSVNTVCVRDKSSRLLNDVEAAINRVVAQQPAFLDLKDEASPNSAQYKILDSKAYINAVAVNLVATGDCAEPDYDNPYELMHVKDSNEFSETFDLVTSSMYMRRGIGAYRETCDPAAFPVDPPWDAPPSGSGCGQPYPPPISRIKAKIHGKGPEYYVLDATPLVGPNGPYCLAVGFTDGRTICPIRPEGSPDRAACEAWRVGNAKDTGRPGPTWTLKGNLCTGPASGCKNSPDNQYQLLAYLGGMYTACAENGACGDVLVER